MAHLLEGKQKECCSCVSATDAPRGFEQRVEGQCGAVDLGGQDYTDLQHWRSGTRVLMPHV